eukprot:TRINITY_DN1449_c1_g1_i1.p1 TRINITY_DN1449_c1_g1~~TRINITY_DN1449_c1_g1_i1.p1  ORF type:complete len:338 (+),score=5.40 TRINITY_DN1449_c1_g1_i1:2-1015(+)
MDDRIFDCSICADRLDDAMETTCCHHCYCKRCIEDWMQVKKSCPSCRKALTALNLVPNVPIQRMINNLPAECPNSKLGCTSKLTRGIVKDHVLSSCAFVEILCANQCGVKVFKRDHVSHQRESCSRRLTPCKQCSLTVPLDAMFEHMSTQCLKAQILCSNCKALLLRENLHRHHQYECLKIMLTCPFAQFGCQFKGLRPAYNKHLIEDVDLHVGVVIEREVRMREDINKLKNELNELKGNKQNSGEQNPFAFNTTKKDHLLPKPPAKNQIKPQSATATTQASVQGLPSGVSFNQLTGLGWSPSSPMPNAAFPPYGYPPQMHSNNGGKPGEYTYYTPQ